MQTALRHSVHLPEQLTSFIGRQDEIDEISALLDDPDCRIVTLVGSGGVGKTRMALEIAARKSGSFANGVYFIPLQPLKSVENILPAVVEALPFQLQGSQREPIQQLLDYLREKNLLLVIDNFEHLVEGAALLSDLVLAAPGLKILVTSREVLNLKLEWRRIVSGLALPESGSAQDSDALQLFVERAWDLAAFILHHPVQNGQAITLAEEITRNLDTRSRLPFRETSLSMAAIEQALMAESNALQGLNPQQLANQALVEPLTARELEILSLIAQGMSNSAIADTLVVSLSTVKKHITHINAKLDVSSRTQAIVRARELQLL